MNEELVKRLRDEAELCRNETADDVAQLLDEAADALEAASLNERRYQYLRKYAESVTGLRLNWYCDEMDNWGDNSPSFDAAIDAALSGEGVGGWVSTSTN